MHIVQLVNRMHPSPLGEEHYILASASSVKEYPLQCILLGDQRVILDLMDKGTYPLRNISSCLDLPLS